MLKGGVYHFLKSRWRAHEVFQNSLTKTCSNADTEAIERKGEQTAGNIRSLEDQIQMFTVEERTYASSEFQKQPRALRTQD